MNGSGVKVQANPEEIRTAVSNILDNAIQYSNGRVDVSIEIEVPPDDKRVVLRVRDQEWELPYAVSSGFSKGSIACQDESSRR